MSTNFFVNNYRSSGEQNLLEDLIIESIKFFGQDMYFIPRTINNLDKVYTEDDQSSYNQAIPIEIYIENVDGFQGNGEFMSKFGIEIRDQVVFSLAQRRFNEEVRIITNQPRPNEGDLIFFPLNQKCFQIKFVEKFEMYFQLGKLYTWKMTCEVFEYSGEKINTGISEIDSLATTYDTNQLDWAANNISNTAINANTMISQIVPGAINAEIQKEGNTFINFSVADPFSNGTV